MSCTVRSLYSTRKPPRGFCRLLAVWLQYNFLQASSFSRRTYGLCMWIIPKQVAGFERNQVLLFYMSPHASHHCHRMLSKQQATLIKVRQWIWTFTGHFFFDVQHNWTRAPHTEVIDPAGTIFSAMIRSFFVVCSVRELRLLMWSSAVVM